MLTAMLCVGTSAADNHYSKTYRAPYGTPTVDGRGGDDVWKLAPWEDINVNAASGKMTARFKVAHDANLLYFLVEITDATNAVSGELKENVWLQLHSHNCSDPASCTTYTSENMRTNGTVWDIKNDKQGSNDNFKVLSSTDETNTVFTLEWSKAPASAIPADSSTAFGMDWLVDDYTAAGGWIDDQQTWNAYNSDLIYNINNFGSLYCLTQAETENLASGDFYDDIPLSHVAYEAIRYTSENGLFVAASASNPSFYPDMKLTRAQFVTILGRLAGADLVNYTSTAFTDVDFGRDAWFAKYAEWARVNGIVVGSQFMANKEITVAEAVVMMQRFADNIDNCYAVAATPLDWYDDVATVPAWATDAMQWAEKNGLYPLTETSVLSPTKIMTRAMTAMLVYNYDTTVLEVGETGTPTVSVKEPPSDIDWEMEAVINARKFGFVNDGVTPNDDIMAYYLEHYAHYIPIEFPAGKYVFTETINFPERIYVELTPRAEWILESDTVLDYFITLQKGVTDWRDWEGYAQESYIRGGLINVNYKAKNGIGLHGGLHTSFQDFKMQNVLEKGIVTRLNDPFSNGLFHFTNIYFYNDKAVEGTIAIYDNGYDNIFTRCTSVNFQQFCYTTGGMFTQCSGWFNSYGKSLIPNSVYAEIPDGYQSIFNTALVDTFRYGFKIGDWASTTVNDLVWITNSNFYDEATRAQYPMCIFVTNRTDNQIMVNGLAFTYMKNFDFSNNQLPKSVFLNVRYKNSSNPWSTMKNFRDDSKKLLSLISPYSW